MNRYTIEYRRSADGANFHIFSPEGTMVDRYAHADEALTERDRRNREVLGLDESLPYTPEEVAS